MNAQSSMYNDLSTVLLTREQIAEGVRNMGQRITAEYQGKSPIMLCILKGASVFFTDLVRQIDLPILCDFMAISSYHGTQTTGRVRILKDLDRDITGCDMIVVEDIVDTGLTLAYITEMLKTRGAASVRVVTLLDKPERRRVPLEVDYSCFRVPDAFVVGYGLDYDERYRNLPDIGILKPCIYTKA